MAKEACCDFTVCPNPICTHVLKGSELFGKYLTCPKCGNQWIATWALYKKCSEGVGWHLQSHIDYYRGQTELTEWID